MRRPGVALFVTAVALGLTGAAVVGRPVDVLREADQNVSESPSTISDMARISVTHDGGVHVVWEEGLNIMHRRMRPNGQWLAPMVLFYGGSQPAIASDGRSVAAAFVRDARIPNDKPVVHTRLWSAESESWSDLSPAVELSEDGAQPDLDFSPRDLSLWVAWSDHTYDTGRPYVARISGGVVTQAHRCGNFDVAMAPSLAVDSEGNVFVARTDMLAAGEEPQVAYAKLPFGGASCVSDEGPPAYGARIPSLAIKDDDFCLAWQQELGADEEIILGCRVGGSWSAPNLSNSSQRSVIPRLTLDETMGSLVVWEELLGNGAPGGVLFRQNVPPPPSGQAVNDSGSTATNPDLGYRRGIVHAVWTDPSAGFEVRYARWSVTPPTATPTASATLSPTPTRTSTPPPPPGTTPAPLWYIFVPFATTPLN